jgi:hypothetical protein
MCQSDTVGIAQMANTCQRRLIYAKEASEDGWWGGFAEMAFNVSRANPYLTLPREVARVEFFDVCQRPVPIQNQFYEYLRFGNGRMPKDCRRQRWNQNLQVYSRNVVPTFTDLANAPQILTCYLTDPADAGKRVLLQGTDNNGNVIYSQDGLNQVTGIYVTLRAPFTSAPVQFNTITGIQKDQTSGNVQIFQTDPTSGAQVLLLTMEPSEQTAGYRRYLFDPLRFQSCCPGSTATTVSVTAIVKLDLIPVQVDQDYLLIQNIEAMIEEAQSVRLSEVDNKASKAMAAERHIQAIRMLNGELTHYLGMNEPAVEFAPFGSAKLSRLRVGNLM